MARWYHQQERHRKNVNHEERCLPPSKPLSGKEGEANLRMRGKVASTSTGSVNQPKCLGIELWHPRGQQCLTTNYACREGRGASSYTYVSLECGEGTKGGRPGTQVPYIGMPTLPRTVRTIFHFCGRSQKFWQYRREYEQYGITRCLFKGQNWI